MDYQVLKAYTKEQLIQLIELMDVERMNLLCRVIEKGANSGITPQQSNMYIAPCMIAVNSNQVTIIKAAYKAYPGNTGKIPAIKEARMQLGIGLKEAKEMVEDMEAKGMFR